MKKTLQYPFPTNTKLSKEAGEDHAWLDTHGADVGAIKRDAITLALKQARALMEKRGGGKAG